MHYKLINSRHLFVFIITSPINYNFPRTQCLRESPFESFIMPSLSLSVARQLYKFVWSISLIPVILLFFVVDAARNAVVSENLPKEYTFCMEEVRTACKSSAVMISGPRIAFVMLIIKLCLHLFHLVITWKSHSIIACCFIFFRSFKLIYCLLQNLPYYRALHRIKKSSILFCSSCPNVIFEMNLFIFCRICRRCCSI